MAEDRSCPVLGQGANCGRPQMARRGRQTAGSSSPGAAVGVEYQAGAGRAQSAKWGAFADEEGLGRSGGPGVDPCWEEESAATGKMAGCEEPRADGGGGLGRDAGRDDVGSGN